VLYPPPPTGPRRLAALVVRQCSFDCGGTHLHRGGDGIRKAGCGRGWYYVIGRPVLRIVGGAA
jgi:hypothetical protein